MKTANSDLSDLTKSEQFKQLESIISNLTSKLYYDIMDKECKKIIEKNKGREPAKNTAVFCIANYIPKILKGSASIVEKITAQVLLPPVITFDNEKIYFELGTIHNDVERAFESAVNYVIKTFDIKKEIKSRVWVSKYPISIPNEEIINKPKRRGRPPKIQKVDSIEYENIQYKIKELDTVAVINGEKLLVEFEISHIVPMQLNASDKIIEQMLDDLALRCESKYYLNIGFK